jgi:hypothetical protein
MAKRTAAQTKMGGDVTVADLARQRKIESLGEFVSFLGACVDFFGMHFHPDTGGHEYIEVEWDSRAKVYEPTGTKTFTAAQAKAFDRNRARAFAFAEEDDLDIYAVDMVLAARAGLID